MNESRTPYSTLEREVKELIHQPLPKYFEESNLTLEEAWLKAKIDRQILKKEILLGDWDYLNRSFRGFRPNEFSILCGATGTGKTTLLANMAKILIEAGVPSYIGSIEIGESGFINKIISILTGKHVDHATAFSNIEIENIESHFGPILNTQNAYLSCYDSRVNHMRMLCDIYHAHKTRNIQVALVDNLNFMMDVKRSEDQVLAMDKTVHDFVVFTKKVPVHIIMVMHPKKTDNGRVESEFDIKGSSTAVQEATNIFLWNRLRVPTDAPMDVEADLCRELKIVKARYYGRSVGAKIIFKIEKQGERLIEAKML